MDYKSNPALKKLQFEAPGPKMAAVYDPEKMKQENGQPGTVTRKKVCNKNMCKYAMYTHS